MVLPPIVLRCVYVLWTKDKSYLLLWLQRDVAVKRHVIGTACRFVCELNTVLKLMAEHVSCTKLSEIADWQPRIFHDCHCCVGRL